MSAVDLIRSGDVERLRDALARDRSLAAGRDDNGVSALLIALYHGRRDLAGLIREAKSALDVFEATGVGAAGRVAELLDADPAQAAAWSPDGFTALHFAAFFGQPAVAKLLLERGADPAAVARNPMLVQPLHSAAAAGNREVAALLLKAGADPNARQHGGWTPLQASAQHGDRELAQLLLAYGADPHQPADDGRTPLDLATANGHTHLLDLFTPNHLPTSTPTWRHAT